MRKKLIIIAIILTALFLLSGCTEVTFGFYLKSNGKVEKKYNVVIDPEGNFGPYNADYALEIARAQLEGMLEQDKEYGEIIINDDNKYNITLIYKYDSLNEYYRSIGITGDDKPEERTSTTDYGLIYSVTSDEVFSDINDEMAKTFIMSMKNAAFPSIGSIPYEDITVNLEYGTKYRKSYTSNATETYLDGKTKIFKWTMNADQLYKTKTISIKQPNYAVWYSFSICLSIIASVLLYIFINKRRKVNDARE